MEEFLKMLNQYSALVNLALFGTILAFLFRIAVQSRAALIDKHGAELAIKDQQMAVFNARIESLELRLSAKDESHSAKLDVLNLQLGFFQKLAALPEDQRALAIQHQYEQKLAKLEEQVAQQAVPKKEAELELLGLKEEATRVSKLDAKTLSRVIEMTRFIAQLIT